MNRYKSIKLDKTMYKGGGGFAARLEELDPSADYRGTPLEGLDAYQRQLKRFDIRVSGPRSLSLIHISKKLPRPKVLPHRRPLSRFATPLSSCRNIISNAAG